MLLVTVTMSWAQVTTSAIAGKVTDASGEVLGANVVAVHQPSGTMYGAMTNEDGRYTISGMRAGGPYKVTVSYVGMESKEIDNITLQLGETYRCNVKLNEAISVLGEAIIVSNSFDASKTGAGMHISSSAIQELPSIGHGVADIARMSPQVRTTNSGAMYFAGTNNRYNSFQIDGAMNNDVFGLTSNGSNGGQAGTNPVSMETIEQIQISVAPFDVRQSGFTGGAINAITKSGTNEFHGSVYGYGYNQELIGSKYKLMNGKTSEKVSDQESYQWGVTVGGPIVKNKLFFFANYEKTQDTYDNAYAPGASTSKVNATVAQAILEYLQAKAVADGTTFDGVLGTGGEYTKSEKYGIKLDWNITNNHHASFRWSSVNAKQKNQTSSASSLNGSNYAYDFESNTNSFVAELQSRFGSKAANELRASYVRVRDKRNPGAASPMIQIKNVGNGTLNLGNERSSMANALDQDIWTITDNFTWYLGNHTVTAGTHNEFYKFCNLFIQDLYGTYYYANVDDFYAGVINQYRYQNVNAAVTGSTDWRPEFAAGQLGFYAQDKWNITDRFDLTYGLRVDIPLFFDTPTANEDFNKFSHSMGWNYKTNQDLSSTPMWSPRLGFRWQVDDESNYILRGGVGIFTGRIPFVWLSNSFTNTGIQMVSYNITTSKTTDPNSEGIQLILDPNKQSENVQNLQASGSQTINVFDKDFKFAQTLRANLAFDFNAAGIKWTVEGIYSKTLNDVIYQNLAVDVTGTTVGDTYKSLSFDQRPMFSSLSKLGYSNASTYSGIYALSNTNEGYTYNLSLKGEKSFDFGLDLMASYTFTQSKTCNSGASSVAASNWNYNYTMWNSNDPELGYSAYNVPNAVTASAYYHHNWNKNARNHSNVTTVGLIYQGTSGTPYSLYYYGDLNGDGTSNDLMFIPTSDQLAQMEFLANSDYTADQQRANMEAWIEGDDYLSSHRGQYFKRYGDNEDFENHFDFHLDHKYGFMLAGSMRYLQVSFDIMNVGNLFNKEWGRTSASSGYYSPVTYKSNGQFQFLHDADYQMRSYSDFYSRWRGQVGVKFTF
jgi:hypothetical protein